MNERIKEFVKQVAPSFGENQKWAIVGGTDIEKFTELIVRDYAQQLVQANMTNPEYARAMDAYYEQKWAHRFD